MDKIEKFLKKLSKKDFVAIQQVLERILNGDTKGLNLKKLSGYQNLYRIRVRDFRVIFLQREDDIEVLEIVRRNEGTYKNF